MVERSLCMREARGSIPRISIPFYQCQSFPLTAPFLSFWLSLASLCSSNTFVSITLFLRRILFKPLVRPENSSNLRQLPCRQRSLAFKHFKPSPISRKIPTELIVPDPVSIPSTLHLFAKGVVLLHQIMLISRVGFWIAKELSRGGYTYMSRTRYRQMPCHQYRRSLLELLPKTRAFQGAIFHKHREFSTSTSNNASEEEDEQKEMISVTFVSKDGEEVPIRVPIGMSMLEAAHENDIELEGACEGTLACSTCHVIVTDMEYYNKLEDPIDEENDMLDLALGLTKTSRLGCQIIASPEIDGIRLAVPAATRVFAVDGYAASYLRHDTSNAV